MRSPSCSARAATAAQAEMAIVATNGQAGHRLPPDDLLRDALHTLEGRPAELLQAKAHRGECDFGE